MIKSTGLRERTQNAKEKTSGARSTELSPIATCLGPTIKTETAFLSNIQTYLRAFRKLLAQRASTTSVKYHKFLFIYLSKNLKNH